MATYAISVKDDMERRLLEEFRNAIPHMERVFSQLFHHPEVAFEEHKSVETICSVLENAGFVIERPLAKLATAFRATFPMKEGHTGQGLVRIGLLVQYDALPELGQACGHHIIAAGMTGAALALAPLVRASDMQLVVIGCPAEETGGGKVLMVREGVFDDLDVAMMFHPHLRACVLHETLAMAGFDIEVHGHTAHASRPSDEGINALEILIGSHNVINGLRQGFARDLIINFVIQEGGVASNIVPGVARGVYFFNHPSGATLREVVRKTKDIHIAVAKAVGGTASFMDHVSYEPLRQNRTFSKVVMHNMQRLDLPVDHYDTRFNSYTDMGDVSARVPTVYPTIRLGGTATPHTREFTESSGGPLGEQAAEKGGALIALTALEFMRNAELRTGIVEEFKQMSERAVFPGESARMAGPERHP